MEPTRRRWPKALAVFALVLAIAAVAGWLHSRKNEQAQAARPRSPPAVPVIAEPVRFGDGRTVVEAVGTARARRSVTLFPAAAGEVKRVLFHAGDRFDAGAPLLELDARRQRLALAQAQVELRSAQQLLQRYERTKGTGAVPENLVDQGRTAVDAARIAVREAEVDLADRTLRAPFDGHVGFTDIDPGDRVDTTTEVATFDDRGELYIDFAVPEAHVGRIEAGHAIRAEPWSGAGAPVHGEVERVGTRIDPQQRSFQVRASLPNADDALRPGSSFKVALELRGRRHPLLPEAAIVWGGEGSFVWKLDEGGNALRVPALIVERRDGRVLVDAPLVAGDRIVVEGVQRLREGMPVRVHGAAASAGPGP